ncbi:hypothetical protein DRQ26_03805 [bacterium]|nr:MAG: hypothetical protein DRQ26_03805 [bacterium]
MSKHFKNQFISMNMNLIEYLLKNGVSYRETAIHLIKSRMVSVNGRIVTYPDLPLQPEDKISVLREEYRDVPPSFWKLKEIQDSLKLIQKGDFILDVESPDGGFPLFAARMEANVILLTIKNDFGFLKKEGIEIIKKNVLREIPEKFLSNKFDIIMIETGFDIMKNMQILEKLRPYIGSRGKLIMFLPSRGRENVKEMAEEILLNQKLEAIEFFDTRKGFYVYAKAV